jgi:hypothetical protein
LEQVTLVTPLALVTKVVISVVVDEDVDVAVDEDELPDPSPQAKRQAEVIHTKPISAARFIVSTLVIVVLLFLTNLTS